MVLVSLFIDPLRFNKGQGQIHENTKIVFGLTPPNVVQLTLKLEYRHNVQFPGAGILAVPRTADFVVLF